MKVQYFADVSDYRKYALLRAFARTGLKIGVCWTMTEPDGRSDGKNRQYKEAPGRWRHFDPELFDVLKTVLPPPDMADLQRVEREGLVNDAAFYEAMTPDDLIQRRRWHDGAMNDLDRTDLVFFDPDNGFEVPSCPKGRKKSSKYIYYDEVADHYERGRTVLVYQHFQRKRRDEFISELADRMRQHLTGAEIWKFKTSHVVFMLGVRPEHKASALSAVQNVESALRDKLMIRCVSKLFPS